MRRIYFSLVSILVFLPTFAFSQVYEVLGHTKMGEVNFGVVRGGKRAVQVLTLENPTDEAWTIPLIDVSGKGFRVRGRNYAMIGPHSKISIEIEFEAGAYSKSGLYEGHCIFNVRNPDGTYNTYEFDLKAEIAERESAKSLLDD